VGRGGCCDIGGGVGVNLIGLDDSLTGVLISLSLPVFPKGESKDAGCRSRISNRCERPGLCFRRMTIPSSPLSSPRSMHPSGVSTSCVVGSDSTSISGSGTEWRPRIDKDLQAFRTRVQRASKTRTNASWLIRSGDDFGWICWEADGDIGDWDEGTNGPTGVCSVGDWGVGIEMADEAGASRNRKVADILRDCRTDRLGG
jgi:hypothetical protein